MQVKGKYRYSTGTWSHAGFLFASKWSHLTVAAFNPHHTLYGDTIILPVTMLYTCMLHNLCMHTHRHTHIHTQTHTCTHTHVHTNTHTCIHTYIHMHTHIHTHAHTHIYTQTHIHTYVYTNTDRQTDIDIHRHTHAHARTHTHTLTRVHGNKNTNWFVQIYFSAFKHKSFELHAKSLQDGQYLLSNNTQHFNIDPVELIKTPPGSRLWKEL